MKLKVKDFGHPGDSCKYFFHKRGFPTVESMEEADIVVFNGGADIATEIYGQRWVKSRVFNQEGEVLTTEPTQLSTRDKVEIIMYKRAKALGKFIFGVCRGAQLINCLEGGTLWQHVNNHNGNHPIFDLKTGHIFNATSVHHQMLRVPVGGEIIAVASESTFKVDALEQKRINRYDLPLEKGDDPEVVWFRDARALCVQGHPEYHPDSLFASYCVDLIISLYHDGVWPPKKAARQVAM